MEIEKLLIKQAQLSDLRKEIKAKACMESARCTRMQSDSADGFPLRVGRSCMEDVYQGWKDCFDADPCQNVRDLKRQRVEDGRALAGVRAAITRVGRMLAKEQGNGC